MVRPLMKVDTDGNYCEFPGINVISTIREANKRGWREFYTCLAQDTRITDYYTLPPYQSFHMTILDLLTEFSESDHDWEKRVCGLLPDLRALHTLLQENQRFYPELVFSGVSVGGALQLKVALSDKQVGFLQQLVGKTPFADKLTRSFHITLGYHYYLIANSEQEQEIETLVAAAFTAAFPSNRVTLVAPKLCYFKDMTRFIPWNGSKYPFVADRAVNKSCFWVPQFGQELVKKVRDKFSLCATSGQ